MVLAELGPRFGFISNGWKIGGRRLPTYVGIVWMEISRVKNGFHPTQDKEVGYLFIMEMNT
jgi:hypothetical protein